MASFVVDDHLLRDVLTARRSSDLDGLASDGLATTGLWLFRLCSSFADPIRAGKLSAPVAGLPVEIQERFRAQLVALPEEIEVLPLRDLSWLMAELQQRHRARGRAMSAAMVEVLAAAHTLGAGIAVSKHDVGKNLRASARADGISFRTL
ncbi:MAG TPA: hypothetical protein VK277_12350 [Acidimicrobiales bacterium]|nr:hypothetical protein [Acidimicrobiales bacterium]